MSLIKEGTYMTKGLEKEIEYLEKVNDLYREVGPEDQYKCGVNVLIVKYKGHEPWRCFAGYEIATADIGKVGKKMVDVWVKGDNPYVLRVKKSTCQVWVLK